MKCFLIFIGIFFCYTGGHGADEGLDSLYKNYPYEALKRNHPKLTSQKRKKKPTPQRKEVEIKEAATVNAPLPLNSVETPLPLKADEQDPTIVRRPAPLVIDDDYTTLDRIKTLLNMLESNVLLLLKSGQAMLSSLRRVAAVKNVKVEENATIREVLVDLDLKVYHDNKLAFKFDFWVYSYGQPSTI